ncbi:16S rRNA (guanine(966)-N(2))-methyltransferase RsmD [Ruminococcus sp.]|uniref:16S rRNA (guanine(966)-N(2))-methyltransferase RsmD n=1 Tax=Ruminococcus sp. TaxID=41978 RepID=UPI003F0C156C
MCYTYNRKYIKRNNAMRVITGCARGRRLETLEGEDVRPTTDRIKEAIFSIIQFETEGRAFLDLFAGSGQMGIEALSRGAKTACFVDNSKKSLDTVKRNLKTTKLEQNAKTFAMDYQSFLAMCSERFDIAFLDPPYKTGMLQNALGLVPEIMNETGVIIAENPLDEEILSNYGNFVLDRQYRYGKIKISTFRHKDFVQ